MGGGDDDGQSLRPRMATPGPRPRPTGGPAGSRPGPGRSARRPGTNVVRMAVATDPRSHSTFNRARRPPGRRPSSSPWITPDRQIEPGLNRFGVPGLRSGRHAWVERLPVVKMDSLAPTRSAAAALDRPKPRSPRTRAGRTPGRSAGSTPSSPTAGSTTKPSPPTSPNRTATGERASERLDGGGRASEPALLVSRARPGNAPPGPGRAAGVEARTAWRGYCVGWAAAFWPGARRREDTGWLRQCRSEPRRDGPGTPTCRLLTS